ncbi:hypothetical protein [Alkalibacillus aidingensis]|uniref:hypothetical protein n=1 Tax=Alkalibacillus aidingensis TaxID=2747607 RepID=UPI0016609D6E|nr:hypothetical protein [Alkalibacillus aidingensis]
MSKKEWIKKNRKKLLIGAVFVIMLVAIINLYQDKRMYERKLSFDLSNDFSRVMQTIDNGLTMLDTIIEKEEMTYPEHSILTNGYSDLSMNMQEWRGIANRFGKFNKEVSNTVSLNAADSRWYIHSFLDQTEVPRIPPDEVAVTLDESQIEKLTYIRELTEVWAELADEIVPTFSYDGNRVSYDHQGFWDHTGDYNINEDFWIDFMIEADQATEDFLWEEYQVREMRQLLVE